jgi:hypothetical protein
MDLPPVPAQVRFDDRPIYVESCRPVGPEEGRPPHHGGHPLHVPEMGAVAVSSTTSGAAPVIVYYIVAPMKDSVSTSTSVDLEHAAKLLVMTLKST